VISALGLPAETTLHDVRWGREFEGAFYWDFEISGAVPFEHLKGGIAVATGYRQPPNVFPARWLHHRWAGQGGPDYLGARIKRAPRW
jgi:hypothetical protein